MTIVYSIFGVSLLALVGLFVTNYNNIRNLTKDSWNILSIIKAWLKKRRLREQVEDDCKNTIDKLNALVPELQMPDLTLEWIKKDENGQVILEEGKAIVLLSYNRDNVKNLINTTTAYVQKALLPSSRYFLTEPIRKAIDFTVIKGFIANSSVKNMAMNALFIENQTEIFQYRDEYNKVSVVDDNGLLTRMLLREFSLWGGRQAGHTPTDEHYKDSMNFLNFIFEILDKEPDELIPLQFIGNDIKVGVLLVAKPETYNEKGSTPYLRRIREGFASGIRTFYLLARNDKIQILDLVYTELMSIGNFVLQNEPIEFKDSKDRECICYCIEVNEKGNMAKDYKAINECIETGRQVEVTIERVRQDELRCMYNMLIPVIIPRDEITNIEGLRLNQYYIEGMSLNVIPISFIEKGKIKASVLNTDSSPKKLVDLNYSVGSIVTAIVEDPQDGLVNFRIKDSDQKAVAYRENLTYSKYLFLHNLFPTGSELECKIIGADYIHNRLVLQLNNLTDPWQIHHHYGGEKVRFTIYKIDEHCFSTELEEGLSAILPYSELSWIQSEIETEKSKYHRNVSLDGYIKKVDKQKRLIILTLKSRRSPYSDFYNELANANYVVDCLLEESNGYGILGLINNKYKVFIPISETHIENVYFQYQLGQIKKVFIKEVDENGISFIGSFKPFIDTPLRKFANSNKIGGELKVGRLVSILEKAAIYNVHLSKNEKVKARLFIGDVTNQCRIDDFSAMLNSLRPSTFIIKDFDFEHNNVQVSLKELFNNNSKKREQLILKKAYHATILGYKDTNYILAIHELFIEGILPISKRYPAGMNLEVYLSGNNGELPAFFE